MLEYRGVSGAAFRHTLQAERRQERIRAHAQWFRAGRGAHVACHRGELSANGWFGDDPGGSAALCGRGSNSREALSQANLGCQKKGRGMTVRGPSLCLACETKLHFP